jgi:hypothetical protein
VVHYQPMSFIRQQTDQIHALRRTPRENRLGEVPLSVLTVSQIFRGDFHVRDRRPLPNPTEAPASIVTDYDVALEHLMNSDCDTTLNRELGGPLVGQLRMVTADGAASGRGLHTGAVTWGRRSEIKGVLTGVSNAGTHHPPLYDAVAFDQAGQLVGRFDAAFDHDVLGPCLLVASYVFDLDRSDDAAGTTVRGILEGVVIGA